MSNLLAILFSHFNDDLPNVLAKKQITNNTEFGSFFAASAIPDSYIINYINYWKRNLLNLVHGHGYMSESESELE